jgi:hypothetical protein
MSSLLTGINPYGTDLNSKYNSLPLGTGILAPNINDIKRMSDSVDQEVYKDDLYWVNAALEGMVPGEYTADVNDEGYDFLSSFMNSFSKSPGFGNMTMPQIDGSSSVQSNAPLPDAVYTATDVKAPLHANVNNNQDGKTPSEDEVKGMLGAENLAEYASKGLDVDSIVRTAQSVVSQQNALKLIKRIWQKLEQ